MPPIRFHCVVQIAMIPEAIAAQILDLARWPEFQGYGPLPGIRSAEFDVRTETVVGTRIRVHNTDGSSHVEEIVEWDPARSIRLRMHEFTPPLSRLATEFDETWEFDRRGNTTHVRRSFAMNPRAIWAWPILWLVSWLLRAAIRRHTCALIDQGFTP